MNTETLEQGRAGGVRLPGGLRMPSAPSVTVLAAAVLLSVGAFAILKTRSLKYLVACIVAATASAVFLALREKYAFLLYSVGFTMPFFVQTIILQRDEGILSVTGTLLITVALALVGFATGAIGRNELLAEPGISTAKILFICAGILSLVNTTDRTLTFIALEMELEMLLIFLVLINAIRSVEHLITFLRGLCLGFFIECVIFVIQNILGFSFDILGNRRMSGATNLETGRLGFQRGTFDSAPSVAALYFSVMALVLIGVYLSRHRLPIRLPPPLGLAMGTGCLALAAKRAPLAGFVLAVGVMCLLLPRYDPGSMRRLAGVLAVLALPVLLCSPVLLLRAEADHASAYEERKSLTRVAWKMYESHPVVGVGLGTYATVKRQYLPEDWRGWLYTVHNQYLLILAETGGLGLSIFLLLCGTILKRAYVGIRQIAVAYRPLQIALVAALLAVYWEMYWDIFNGRQQGHILWFLVALAVILPRALPANRTSCQPA